MVMDKSDFDSVRMVKIHWNIITYIGFRINRMKVLISSDSIYPWFTVRSVETRQSRSSSWMMPWMMPWETPCHILG